MSSSRPKRETVQHLTYFVVQAYQAVKGKGGGINADNPLEARDHDHAMRLFERYKPIRAGVVAFRRTGSPATGDWEDAVIIARHGILPTEVDGLAEADALDFETGELTDADLKVA